MKQDYFHSVVLNHERCIGCTYCLKICPTEAIRLRNGKASIIAERCIDCGECIRVCPNHAKNAVTDDLKILHRFKYTIGLTLPILYGQFGSCEPSRTFSALKSLGFDEVYDTSLGSEIVDFLEGHVIKKSTLKPVINSSCPAIVRLIQVRFPELLENIIDIETPVEIMARIAKTKAIESTGLPGEDIGIILITPCTARVTSTKKPLGTPFSYIDGTVSMKVVYGPILKVLPSINKVYGTYNPPTFKGILWNSVGGQITSFKPQDALAVSGINNAISVLEEIEMNRLGKVSFIEISACSGGCIGGPLVVENKYTALNNIRHIAANLDTYSSIDNTENEYLEMYNSGFIRLTEKINSKSIMTLDSDISKSIKMMDTLQNIANSLPGINCGICGSPTCRAFAEDIVTGNRRDSICPVSNIIRNFNEDDIRGGLK
jgi:iron only hydrogenase large subunit-like protein